MGGTSCSPTSLKLLSFDGGGVSGLSSLLILCEFMKQVRIQLDLPQTPRPCEIFDLIAGTGTGGIIAIMLGRLGLPVEDAIEAYQSIIKDAFAERKLLGEGSFKTTNLENAIARTVERYTGQTDTPMVNPGGCKTFVCAMRANNMTTGIPTLLRTYNVPENDGPKCTITQAALATTATMGYFKPVILNDSGIGVMYIDGGLSGNNPTAHLLAGAGRVFVDQNVSCVLSIADDYEYRAKLIFHIDALATEFRSDSNLARRFAMVYDEAGRFQAAKSLLEAAVEADKRIFGEGHPDTLTTMFELANTHRKNGELQEAEKLHAAVLEGRTRVLGEMHPDTYRAMAHLSLTYHDRSRYQEAKVLQVKVLEAAKELLGPEARETLLSQLALATTYQSLGRLYEAESLYLESVETQKRVLGTSHPATLTTMHNLAGVLELLNKLDDAEAIAIVVLQTRRQTSGENHPETLAMLGMIASIKYRRGQYEEAARMQEEILKTHRHTLGELHPQTLRNQANLACTYQSLGRLPEAEEIYHRVLEVQIRVHGRGHPDVVSRIINLAAVYSSLGKQEQAETMMVEGLAANSKVWGSDDTPEIAALKASLANLYAKQMRWKDAEVLMREAIATCEATYGLDHYQVKLNLQSLNKIESALRREAVIKWMYYLTGFLVAVLSVLIAFMHTHRL